MDTSSVTLSAPTLVLCPAAIRPDHPASYLGLSALRSLSVSHNTTSFDELERRSLDPEAAAALRRDLATRGIASVVLVTCNRTEIYWHARGPEDDDQVRARFAAASRDGNGHHPGAVSFARGQDAALHLFRVACGLESLLLGEHEVMGQVRDAIGASESAGESSPLLSSTFAAALRCAGRARAQTGIGTGALSVASSAVQLLAEKTGGLARLRALVIGAGQTGHKAARHLRLEGVGSLVIMNRTLERAQAAAQALNAEAASLDDLPRHLAEVDAVITAVGASEFLLTVERVREALPDRAGRPLTIVDLSMPRAVDPAVEEIPGVVVHDLSGLETQVLENRARREREIPGVEAVIERELCELGASIHHHAIRPLVTDLCIKAESIRRVEVERARENGVPDGEVLEYVTKRLVSRLLASPLAALRDGALGLDDRHADYLRNLFGLDSGSSR